MFKSLFLIKSFMEIKQRESTLDVLRRLQAKNKKPIPSMYEKSPVKIKVEDIVDDIPAPREKVKIRLTGKNSEALFLLNQIRDIERQLKTGSNYFDYYYDLRRKEDALVKMYESDENRESLPEDVLKKVKEIKKKFNK